MLTNEGHHPMIDFARYSDDEIIEDEDDGENHCPICNGIMHEVRFCPRTGESLWRCEGCEYED